MIDYPDPGQQAAGADPNVTDEAGASAKDLLQQNLRLNGKLQDTSVWRRLNDHQPE